jgi:flavodoxin
MLTYNEKDLLIQNAYIVQRVNHMNMSADFSVRDAYKLALQAIESERDIPSLSRFSNGKRREKYSDLFVGDGGYYGFKFVEISIWSRLWRWLLLFLGLSLHSSVLMLMARTFEGWPLVLLTLVILFVFEMYIYATNDPMYREIYKINLENVHGMDRVKEFFKSSVFAAFVEAARLVVLTVIVYVSFVEYQPSFIPIFMIIIIFYLGRIAVNSGIKILFESRLKEFSDEFLAVHISRNENVNYLIVAYIYCMMLKVNEFYLEYKSEILDSESSISMSVKYRKSRVAIRRTLKSILMHKDSRSQ